MKSKGIRRLACLVVLGVLACSDGMSQQPPAGVSPAVQNAAAATGATRIGDVARQLSDRDIADIQRFLPNGVKPWLIAGESGQVADIQFIQVHLPPETIGPELRRGKVILLRRRVEKGAARGAWVVVDDIDDVRGRELQRYSGSYAHAAVDGVGFVQVQDVSDIYRPFFVIGQFDDDELTTVARWIRTHPDVSYRSAKNALPILAVSRLQNNSVRVWLRLGESAWRYVDLHRDELRWVVVGAGEVEA